ncbi:MAG: anaerobic ribonucleoside-triphosphate reductase activating protein [Clostridiaceae bacterium]|nr:anaerobic ribonucleoside-triphosphate reductase activating protein [Clostridiaceae bacterium]
MKIGGLMKTTLLDFPGRIACTVFVSGCNFRCPYCHNASLVIPERFSGEEISEEAFFDFLSGRIGKLDGVCISGGEPLLQDENELTSFIRKIKEIGFEVKLDTNGSVPGVLRKLLDEGLPDYVSMDVKNAPEAYAETCGILNPPVDKIRESVRMLVSSKVPYEFRTTVVDELHDENKIRAIARWIGDVPHFFLQSYTDSEDVIEKGFHSCSRERLEKYLEITKEYVPSAQLRGI